MHYALFAEKKLTLSCVYFYLKQDSVRKLPTRKRELPWVQRVTWEN